MARLIIGHTTNSSVNIWIRGSDRYPIGFVRVKGLGKNQTKNMALEERHGYTGVLRFTGLQAATEYTVKVTFSESPDSPERERVDFGHCTGRFRTFRKKTSNAKITFMLGSCNLHTLGYVNNGDRAYRRILEEAEKANADFMLHCGDQIYFDLQVPPRVPTDETYRACYRDAWGDSRPTRKLLTQMPHYMILDDHELVDNFANDSQWLGYIPARHYKDAGIKVYREFQYIHSPKNHGNDSLHYSFNCGKNEFFVLDTRSERYNESREIISKGQMSRFKRWLTTNANKNKFVITSVPFVAENRLSKDKWNGFIAQREEIIEHILKRKLKKLVFLCGDQHNSMYSTMTITDGSMEITVHELMSSPINQIQKSKRSDYLNRESKKTSTGVRYTSTIHDFYNDHSNAMIVNVDQHTVQYQIFRTKRSTPAMGIQSFALL